MYEAIRRRHSRKEHQGAEPVPQDLTWTQSRSSQVLLKGSGDQEDVFPQVGRDLAENRQLVFIGLVAFCIAS